MALEIEGRIFNILPEESGLNAAGNTWKKQVFVINTNEEFPRKIAFTVWNNNVDALKSLKTGDKVKVYFRVESREYQGRWYTDATAWRIVKIVEQEVTPGRSGAGPEMANSDVIYGGASAANPEPQQTQVSQPVENTQNTNTDSDLEGFAQDDDFGNSDEDLFPDEPDEDTGDDLPF